MATKKAEPRFLVKSDAEVATLVEQSVPLNTRRAIDVWVSVFDDFCKEKNIEIDLTTCSAVDLNKALCHFYPSLRTKKGGVYKKASYFAAREALHRITQELKHPSTCLRATFSPNHIAFLTQH